MRVTLSFVRDVNIDVVKSWMVFAICVNFIEFSVHYICAHVCNYEKGLIPVHVPLKSETPDICCV